MCACRDRLLLLLLVFLQHVREFHVGDAEQPPAAGGPISKPNNVRRFRQELSRLAPVFTTAEARSGGLTGC